jgi:hypothetical protein
MESHRQPAWAFLTIFIWLASGVLLIASLGAVGGHLAKVMVGVFAVLTLAMARAVHVLMDRDEKALPGWALVVVAVLAAVIAAGMGIR